MRFLAHPAEDPVKHELGLGIAGLVRIDHPIAVGVHLFQKIFGAGHSLGDFVVGHGAIVVRAPAANALPEGGLSEHKLGN